MNKPYAQYDDYDCYRMIEYNGSHKCYTFFPTDSDFLYQNFKNVKVSLTVDFLAIIKTIVICINELIYINIFDMITKSIIKSNKSESRLIEYVSSTLSDEKNKYNISHAELSRHTQYASVIACYYNKCSTDVLSVINSIKIEFNQCLKSTHNILYDIYCDISETIDDETSITDMLKLFNIDTVHLNVKQLLPRYDVYQMYVSYLLKENVSRDMNISQALIETFDIISECLHDALHNLIDILIVFKHIHEYPVNFKHSIDIRHDIYESNEHRINRNIIEFIKKEFKNPQTFRFQPLEYDETSSD